VPLESNPAPSLAGINPDFHARRRRERALSVALGAGVIGALLALWEIAARFAWIDPLFSSSPSSVAVAAVRLFGGGELFRHALATGHVFAIGFVLAALVGVPFGIAAGWSKWADRAFSPLISALNTTPRVALMPLLIVWFGLGFGSKVVLVFLSAFFPIVVSMQTAMLNLDEQFRTVARAYGASPRQLFTTVALPASVPFLVSGLRQGVGRALLGIIAAEVFGGSEGLGFLIMYSGQTFQVETVFVCVMLIAAFGIGLDRSFHAIHRRVDHWRGGLR
jgi:ABC-type nitrate/sulfonate/bicarbonate transport system permease component